MQMDEAKQARNRLKGTLSGFTNMRPRDIDTAENYNAFIDRAVGALEKLKVPVAVQVEVETEETTEETGTTEREKRGNTPNREHTGGENREE